MNNFKGENKNNILKEWLRYREEEGIFDMTAQDKEYAIYFEEIAEKILKNVPMQNRQYVQKQLDKLEKNFVNYNYHWNEKYYKNGFRDGIELINDCFH